MALKEKIEQTTTELLQPIIDKHEFELVDVEYVKEAGHWYLRAYIDKPGGITILDCEAVSRELDEQLDENFIKDAYILEVSSPGLDRPLKKEKDFLRHKGDMVEVKLYKAINKRKEFVGVLVAFDDDTVTIEEDEVTMIFTRKDIAIIRLAILF